MVFTGKSKLDNEQYGWIFFANEFRQQFKKMPKTLSFRVEDIPYLCFCYANGWIKKDFAEYKDGKIEIQRYAFNYNRIIEFIGKGHYGAQSRKMPRKNHSLRTSRQNGFTMSRPIIKHT